MASIRMGLPMYNGPLDVNELPVSDGSGTAPKPPESPAGSGGGGSSPAPIPSETPAGSGADGTGPAASEKAADGTSSPVV